MVGKKWGKSAKQEREHAGMTGESGGADTLGGD